MPIVQVHEALSGGERTLRFQELITQASRGCPLRGRLSPSEYGVEFTMGFPTPPRSNEVMLARIAQ